MVKYLTKSRIDGCVIYEITEEEIDVRLLSDYISYLNKIKEVLYLL